MKVNLIAFQDKAVKELRVDIADALDSYRRRGKTQVVSLQAPTGAGKTIIAASLIEDIYFGSTLADGTTFDEQPEAIFVWLSDSPELNAQSKQKIELKTSKLRFGQCVTIVEDSFDMEMLEDGHVYFLNTQKISRSGKLTQHSDDRQYTIWETLDNTIQNKSDHLYFIIDEAHRGAKSKREAGTDTTIMQRFIKGYTYTENGMKRTMRSMPVILGISATAERFNTLVGNTTNVGLMKYVITADEVRGSGLLKDRIVITYPEDPTKNNDIVLLEAAVEEWLKKCKRWYQYTSEQHYTNVDPVLVVQVCQGSGGALSDTNLEDVLAKIEEKVGTPFKAGEVVHCFGEGTTVELNGLHIPHVKASEIADDHKIKVVFFKEALSTGWDCPRAETMMSFAVRNDPTYIAQLLGRMVRTPLQMRVMRDEFLNDVKLYLPHFNKDTVKKVVEELQSSEGGEIPTEINGESLEEPTYITWTVHTPRRARQVEPDPNQMSIFDNPGGVTTTETPAVVSPATNIPYVAPATNNGGNSAPEYIPPRTVQIHSYEFQEQYWRGKFDGDPNNELVHIYADRGISGCSVYKRPEFMKMLQDARAGQFDVIHTKSVSRFARNTVELLEAVRELRDMGVEVIFEKEQISTMQPTSELFLTIAATIAENDLEVDSKRQKWSIQHRFENGCFASIANTLQGSLCRRSAESWRQTASPQSAAAHSGGRTQCWAFSKMRNTPATGCG